MTWRVARYFVGSLVVLGLAACGRSFFQERDAWRHEAEVACLKTGAVKEGPSLVRIQPIAGPGICGADFPIKVSAIGEGSAIGFADELRPPGSIPGRQPLAAPPRQAYPRQAYPQQGYPAQAYPQQAYPQQAYPPQGAAPNGPMSINAPGVDPAEVDEEGDYQAGPQDQAAQPYPSRGTSPQQAYPQQAYPQPGYPPRTAPATRAPTYSQPAEQVPLGAQRAPVTTGSTLVQPAATLACPIVSQLDAWFASGVQPAAMRWLGSPVVEIRQISAYSCRGMNGQRGAPISEHAFGNALDIAAFTLADGRKITVKDGWRGLPEEQGFLRDVHASACQNFSTVLAPGSNIYHYDHIHVDLARRASGRRVCNPAPIPGDQIAARAGYRYSDRGDNGVTGSVKAAEPAAAPTRVVRRPAFHRMLGRDEVYDKLPRAVPGED